MSNTQESGGDKDKKPTNPIDQKGKVQDSKDPRIDEDFPGFPGEIATEEKLNPQGTEQEKTAATDVKDGEKKLDADKEPNKDSNRRRSDGSANAFERTELSAKPLEDEDDGGSKY